MIDFQTLATEELAGEAPPPRDVVGAALRSGKRHRLLRRSGLTTGVLATVVALAVGVATVPPWAEWRLRRQASVAAASVPWAGPLVPATPAGTLEALRYLLPPGHNGPYSGQFWEYTIQVDTELTTPAGTGVVHITMNHRADLWEVFKDADVCTYTDSSTKSSCVRVVRADGTIVTLMHMIGNCVEDLFVEVYKPSSTNVYLTASACRNDGTPAHRVLNDDEAVAIATNPIFEWKMPSSLVEAGGQQFPDLPTSP